MSSDDTNPLTAEQRFRQAFERLKNDDPKVLKQGTPVSQNNVAKEAGCDPSALRKLRFPSLVREIQAYIELHSDDRPSQRQALLKRRRARRSLQERLDHAERQRDAAQSLMLSANRKIVELTEQVQGLEQEIAELRPPPPFFRG